ncbi:MAG TPA: hypothetical protein VIO33_16725 [Burkholderiaceae bacterium]
MKAVAIALALGAAGWYYFVGGRQLDEQMVRDFYRAEAHATLSRDPDALCKLLSKSVVVRQQTLMSGQTKSETLNREQACEAFRKSHEFFEQVGEKAGGMLTIEYDYELGKLDVASDRKSALVEFSSTLKMGESFMQFRTTSTERLVRRLGRVELAEADAMTRVSWTPGALADPARYFQAQ